MANQYQNTSLTEQVRQHGEMLTRLTVLVEEDHEDLKALKKSTEIIADVVAEQKTRELMQAGFKAKIKEWVIPIGAVLAGALAAHFIH